MHWNAEQKFSIGDSLNQTWAMKFSVAEQIQRLAIHKTACCIVYKYLLAEISWRATPNTSPCGAPTAHSATTLLLCLNFCPAVWHQAPLRWGDRKRWTWGGDLVPNCKHFICSMLERHIHSLGNTLRQVLLEYYYSCAVWNVTQACKY